MLTSITIVVFSATTFWPNSARSQLAFCCWVW